MDVPLALLGGLVLHASGNVAKLAQQWAERAVADAQKLAGDRVANTLELEGGPRVDALQLQLSAAVINPIIMAAENNAVGYVPLKFASAPDIVFWALVDSGAQVSVISAGLANYLDLIQEDYGNVTSAPFTVKGYNDARSYMPALTTSFRLGAHGGPERYVAVQLCVYDSNEYKLLIGVDILRPL